jgi:autotransporter-associated beta strand protein
VDKDAEEALRSTLDFFGAKADSANMSLYNFAHRKVDNPAGYTIGNTINVQVFNNNIYDDKAEAKKIYRERLTYGFTQDTTKANLAPIVPKGAEAILKSRFPYLTDNQRRGVLYTTEIPSGFKILDKTNGWGRIDLITAADGYGSFIGDVYVNMDSSLGRFNVLDSWGNDIDGKGCLIKDGTGKLVLTGNNSYSGGTIIKGGTLATTSKTALGDGDVLIQDEGTLEMNRPLNIKGKFTQNGGEISVRIVSDTIPLIIVNRKIELQNSTLIVTFDNQIHPKTGDKFAIIKGKELLGNFERIKAEGDSCVAEKRDQTIYIVVQ